MKTTGQKLITRGAAAIAIAILLFPPVNLEKRLAFNTVDESLSPAIAEITSKEFIGWHFIGQSDIHTKAKPEWKPKDPDNLTLYDRITAPGLSTPEEEAGTKRIDFLMWGFQFLALAMLTGLALLGVRFLNKKPKA